MVGTKWDQLNRRDHMRRHGVTSVTDDREVIAMLGRSTQPNPKVPKAELRREAAAAMTEWANRQGHNKPADPQGVSARIKPKP
jgi:hypothetical protein